MKRPTSLRAILRALALPLGLAACGGSEPPPAAPPPPPRPRAEAPRLQMHGELGILDERAVDATFRGLLPQIQACIEKGSARVEMLAGTVRPFIRVDSEGRVKWAYLAESTLGDRATESCILDAVRAARWPKPVEGDDGQAEKPFEFDPPEGVRAAVDWPAEKGRAGVASVRGKLAACPPVAKGPLRATAWVGTDGRVLSVGIAANDATGEKAADCVADALRGMKLPSPGSWPAKVTFDVE